MRFLLGLLPLLLAGQTSPAPATVRPTPNRAPILLSSSEPVYAAPARAAGYQGSVAVYLEVSLEGIPANVQVLHGLGLGLDEAAVEAVRKWRYKPAMVNGQPEVAAISVDVPFRYSPMALWSVPVAAYQVDPSVPIMGTRLDPGQAPKSEVVRKPVLSRYVAPAAACPSDGPLWFVTIRISATGVPLAIQGAPSALLPAIQEWRYRPATVNGEDRASFAQLELHCGADEAQRPGPVYRVGGNVTAPGLAFRVNPEYSDEARQAQFAGTVMVSVAVDATGHPAELTIFRMIGLGLDQKALEAVRMWRFKPGLLHGEPAKVRAQIEVNFRLK